MMTDPVADMLTRIRNANRVGKPEVDIPYSKLKEGILKVLKGNGFITDYRPEMEAGHGVLRVALKYGPDGEKILSHIRRVSKPGRRVYVGAREIRDVLGGLGILVLSTPNGVVSSTDARQLRVGGEVLCEVW